MRDLRQTTTFGRVQRTEVSVIAYEAYQSPLRVVVSSSQSRLSPLQDDEVRLRLDGARAFAHGPEKP